MGSLLHFLSRQNLKDAWRNATKNLFFFRDSHGWRGRSSRPTASSFFLACVCFLSREKKKNWRRSPRLFLSSAWGVEICLVFSPRSERTKRKLSLAMSLFPGRVKKNPLNFSFFLLWLSKRFFLVSGRRQVRRAVPWRVKKTFRVFFLFSPALRSPSFASFSSSYRPCLFRRVLLGQNGSGKDSERGADACAAFCSNPKSSQEEEFIEAEGHLENSSGGLHTRSRRQMFAELEFLSPGLPRHLLIRTSRDSESERTPANRKKERGGRTKKPLQGCSSLSLPGRWGRGGGGQTLSRSVCGRWRQKPKEKEESLFSQIFRSRGKRLTMSNCAIESLFDKRERKTARRKRERQEASPADP